MKLPVAPGPVHVPERVLPLTVPLNWYPPPDTTSGPLGEVKVPVKLTGELPVSVSVPVALSVVVPTPMAGITAAAGGVIVKSTVPLAPPVPVSVPEYVEGVEVPPPELFELEWHPTTSADAITKPATIRHMTFFEMLRPTGVYMVPHWRLFASVPRRLGRPTRRRFHWSRVQSP